MNAAEMRVEIGTGPAPGIAATRPASGVSSSRESGGGRGRGDGTDRPGRGPQKLGEAREWAPGPRLDAARVQHAHRPRTLQRILEQRGLPDTGLADDGEHAAAAVACLREEPVKR